MRQALKHTMTARTAAQRVYVAALQAPAARLVVATGCAGTGKTHLAVTEAMHALARGDTRRLVFTRATVSAEGEDLGYLPGTAEEKMEPYARPMMDALARFVTKAQMRQMCADGSLELAPLAFMRGRTFSDAWLILDEAQNTTPAQMRMALTRAGANTKVVVTGDLDQSDVPGVNGLADLLGRIGPVHQDSLIQYVVLGEADIQRSELVREVLRLYGSPRAAPKWQSTACVEY